MENEEYLDWSTDFGVCYTPLEMLDKGVYLGVYTDTLNVPSKYKHHQKVTRVPKKNINCYSDYSPTAINYHKTKEVKPNSVLSWWSWYIGYYGGRRSEVDAKFITNWKYYVSKLCDKLKEATLESDKDKVKQSLLEVGWDWELDFNDAVVSRNTRAIAKSTGNVNLNTEFFKSSNSDLVPFEDDSGLAKLMRGFNPIRGGGVSSKIELTASARSLLPLITVEEENGYITVTGFNYRKFETLVKKVVNSSRFKYMFNHTGWRKFKFQSFFAVEVVRSIELVLEKRKDPGLLALKKKLVTNTWLGEVVKSEPLNFNYSRLDRLNTSLLPKQMEFLKTYQELVPRLGLTGWLLAAAPGTGKALKNGTYVRTPDFWTPIEKLKVGDLVIGDDGKPTKVVGVYPQGSVDLYEITFYDGRKIVACSEHQWKIYDGRLSKKPHDERWRVTNTKDIFDYYKNSNRFRCYVPLTKPVELPKKNLKIDPYLLGCLLGDGSFAHKHVNFYKTDSHIVERLSSLIDDTLSLKPIYREGKLNGYRISRKDTSIGYNQLFQDLDKLGLVGSRSYEKFIPGKYLEGSVEQRWEMVRGLMDTDGTVDSKTATISYSTTSKFLARGMQKLVHSLGGIAKISSRYPTFTYCGEKKKGRLAYNVTIRHPEPSNFFSLPRKKDLTRPSQYSENLKLSIKEVKPVSSGEATCISVDNESKLFLADNYVVTHNTLTGLSWHLVNEFDTTIIISPNNAVEDVWEDNIFRFFKETPKYWLSRPGYGDIKGDEEFIVCHYEHLGKLLPQLTKLKGKRVGMWLDESHNFNELTSARTNIMIDIALSYCEQSVLASGTPLKALGKELVPLFRIIDHRFTPDVERRFIKVFGSTKGSVLKLLQFRMDRSAFKVAKEEVVQNEVNEYELEVEIPNYKPYLLSEVKEDVIKYVNDRTKYYAERREEYIEEFFGFINTLPEEVTLTKDYSTYIEYARIMHRRFNPYEHNDLIKFCSKFEKDYIYPNLEPTDRKLFKSVAGKYKYIILVIRGEALGRILTRRRIECVRAMVPFSNLEGYVDEATKKTVIFTNYTEVVEDLNKHFTELGYSPRLVYGKTNNELSDTLKAFKDDPKANPIIATYKSLSTAVPLIEASTIVLFDSPFRNYIIEQTIARLDRYGQDSAISVIRAMLKTGEAPNLSTRSIQIAEWSKELVDAILNLSDVKETVLQTEDYDPSPLLTTEYFNVKKNELILDPLPETLYHISFDPNLPKVLKPQLPAGSELTIRTSKDRYDHEPKIPRVCFSTSLIGAFRAVFPNIQEIVEKHGKDGIEFSVYERVGSSLDMGVSTNTLSKKAVWDAQVTDEWWVLDSTKIKKVGKVVFYCDSDDVWLEYDPECLPGNEHIEHSPRDVEMELKLAI